ncbi:hypothetical protein EDB85DRAFT_249814 [Lactarius pseudohatsudake]|nr:hypothetical protein EDB85DRAFT_249814 [Lactarius pseudohatsudake]
MLLDVVSHYRAALKRRTTTACTMIIDPDVPAWIASSTAWLLLLYSTAVVSLTLYRTAGPLHSAPKSTIEIFRVMLREGLLYYSAISTVTLAFTIMVVSADPSVRALPLSIVLFPLPHYLSDPCVVPCVELWYARSPSPGPSISAVNPFCFFPHPTASLLR